MNKTNVSSPAMLKISLPQEIIVPENWDLTAFFALMRTARVGETVTYANDEERPSYDNYAGDSQIYEGTRVVPTVTNAGTIHPTQAAAQAAKNKIVQDILRERAEREKAKNAVAPVAPSTPDPLATV